MTTRSERLLAAGHWLLPAAQTPGQARSEWAASGMAWLRPGTLFTAVIIRAGLVHAAVGKSSPQECAPALAGILDGPVFYRRGEFGPDAGYTVLLPASAARTWRVRGTVVPSSVALLLVPAPDRLEAAPEAPWWVVPPDEQGTLCTPALLASLLARKTATAGGGVDA